VETKPKIHATLCPFIETQDAVGSAKV
jgi:hypothetical protein